MRVALAFAVALTMRAGAQLPDAPRPHLDRAERALLVADAGTRALDTYSTRRMLAQGDREMFLPGFLVNHASALAAYSAGVVVANAWAVHELERHRHRRLAHIEPMIDIAADLPWAIHNLYLPRHRP